MVIDMEKKKIFVTRPSMPKFEDYCNILKDIWETRYLTNMGKYHKIFQAKLKDFLNVPNVELFTNGHMALELSLQAFYFTRKTEIITTPFTFASTTHAIVRNKLKPVFCDINYDDYTLDVTKLENLITDKTCAIMPVHVYGNICNVEEIDRIAKKYSLKVIYDAAHAFGEEYKGENVARFGDVSCFSFHATKVFNSIEGGAACFEDESLGVKLYQLKNFGIKDPENIVGVGANAKMNEFCAAMGLCNLDNLKDDIARRKIIYERYMENLQGVEGLKLNFIQEKVKSNYAYFPVVFDEKTFGSSRNEVFEALGNEGILARKYFYPLTSDFECFHGKFDSSKTPTALYISKRVLTLPFYTDLAVEDVDRICKIILSCKK